MKDKEPTRAELLERCQAAGMRATGWKKEKMALELAKLSAAEPAPEATSEAPSDENQVTGSSPGADPSEDEPGPSRRRRCGWCSPGPMWGRSHLTCRASDRPCGCECNDPDWVRPPIPEGAQLSKFNREDREPLGLPWEPVPGARLADAKKLAGGEEDGAARDAGDPGDAGAAGLAGPVAAAAGPAGAARQEPAGPAGDGAAGAG